MGSPRLEWEGAFNVRDLGGQPAAGGCRTRRGALVRADNLDALTAEGWRAAEAHGIRTVVDLRNDDERGDLSSRPEGIETLHLPLDGTEDREFWDVWENGPQFGTPLYYGPHLERFPERSAAVLSAIARARPGGVVFHCTGGRDRSGQIAMLVLALAGVPTEHIVADYALSDEGVSARCAARGEPDQVPLLAAYLAERGTNAGAIIERTLAGVDVEALAGPDAAALRARLLES